MNDSFDDQQDFDNDGECFEAFAHDEVFNLPSTAATASLVDDITRARFELEKLIRYALIILGQDRKTFAAPLMVNGAGSAVDLASTKDSKDLERKKQARRRTYACKALRLDLGLVRHEFPNHSFHPCATALMDAAQVGQDRWGAYLASPEGSRARKIEIMRFRRDLAQQILDDVLQASRTAKYRRDAERIRHATWQRAESTDELIRYMFEKRSRLLSVRVDLRYRHFFRGERYDASLPGHPSFEMVAVHREHLLNILRRQIFKDCLFSYILRIEWAPGTGFHIHLMLLVDGRERRAGVTIGDLIGHKWRTEVTQDEGFHFNCNLEALKGRYKVRGTGMFHRDDDQGCKGLRATALYLAKADHFMSYYRNDGQRTYSRTRIPSLTERQAPVL